MPLDQLPRLPPTAYPYVIPRDPLAERDELPEFDAQGMAVRPEAPAPVPSASLEQSTANLAQSILADTKRADDVPVRTALAVPPQTWKRFARDRGLALNARPRDLDAWDWVALCTLVGRPPKGV